MASLAAGALFGLGVLLVARAMFPGREPLAASVARLTGVAADRPTGAAVPEGWARRVGAPMARAADAANIGFANLRAQLRVLDRPLEAHLAAKAGSCLFGVVLAPATTAVMTLGGVRVPGVATIWASAALGAAGFVLPDVLARAQAAERRAEFRHALSSFLDLVVIVLAAGGGVQSALNLAAAVGEGWAHEELRRSLQAAQLARRSPWLDLGRLGAELDVSELQDLAATVALAGTEGARVRQSLVAKAQTLRSHQLHASEAQANAATERMAFPVALLVFCFFGLIGYPAVAAVIHGL